MLVELRFSTNEEHALRIEFLFDGSPAGVVWIGSYKGDAMKVLMQWALLDGRIVEIRPRAWVPGELRIYDLILKVETDDEKGKMLRALVSVGGRKVSFWKKLLKMLDELPIEEALERATIDVFVQKL